MNRFAQMFLLAVVAFAAIGIVSAESAEAGCYGYSGGYATPYYAPALHAHTPYHSHTPVYGYGGSYGYGYGYGAGYGYGSSYGYGTGYCGW